MEDVGLIHEDHLQRVIGLLRASYTHLILDLSKSFSPDRRDGPAHGRRDPAGGPAGADQPAQRGPACC